MKNNISLVPNQGYKKKEVIRVKKLNFLFFVYSPGRMFPTRGDLHIAPFTDDSLYMEQFNKANFW
jgi:hypothetical protein